MADREARDRQQVMQARATSTSAVALGMLYRRHALLITFAGGGVFLEKKKR